MASFLDLPPEIRSNIYSHVFRGTSIALLSEPTPRTETAFTHFLTTHNLSLLLTCKLLAHEALSKLYAHVVFNVTDIVPSWIRNNSPHPTSPPPLTNNNNNTTTTTTTSSNKPLDPDSPLTSAATAPDPESPSPQTHSHSPSSSPPRNPTSHQNNPLTLSLPHLRHITFYSLTLDHTLQKPFVDSLLNFRSVDVTLVTYGNDRARMYDAATMEDVELLHKSKPKPRQRSDGAAGPGTAVAAGMTEEGWDCDCPRCKKPTGRPWRVFAVRCERVKEEGD